METFIAFSLPAGSGRGGFLLNALGSLLLGLMIVLEWPSSSIWAIGTPSVWPCCSMGSRVR